MGHHDGHLVWLGTRRRAQGGDRVKYEAELASRREDEIYRRLYAAIERRIDAKRAESDLEWARR
jgi:hypothetical protein